MKKYLFLLLIFLGQMSHAMTVEVFEQFAFAEPNTIEYGGARLWIDGVIGGVAAISQAAKQPAIGVERFPGLNGGQICMPQGQKVADVFMFAGKRELSEKRDFYFKSKLGKSFPMEMVLWTGMERLFPCDRTK